MDHQDPEQRIAELERQLAEQQRINELQQRLAGATSAGNGLQQPDIDRIRAAFSQAASQAGITPDQFDEALKHANVTVRTSHSVIYPGQPNTAGFAPPAGAWQSAAPAGGFTFSQPASFVRPPRRGAGLLGALAAIVFISFGIGCVTPLLVPESVSWASAIVCDDSGQLSYTKQYADRQGSSVDFRCADDGRTVSVYALAGLQTLAAVPIAGVLVGGWRLARRSR